MKYIYRIIILLAVFIGALYYFSGDIKEVVFETNNTTEMARATFPLVTIREDGNEINLLHGYSTNLAANKLRETLIPLDAERTFEVIIDQKDYDIKKLNYEVRDFLDNSLIENGSVSVFEKAEEKKKAKIKLTTELPMEKEYAVKITLISSDSSKMYYYQRIKIYDDSHLKEKLDFIMNFHNSIMDKSKAQQIVKYLEPSGSADNSSLAHVNINSSFELVSWGNLNPVVLSEATPAVIELYSDTASVELQYYVEGEVARKKEKYKVTEFYRVRYTADRMFLLNYDRRMEALFDVRLASVSKNELKLGISSETEVPTVTSADEKKLAFVRDRELWFYDLENNRITRVFSFHQDNTDYLRELYDQHDIRILNMDEEGNLDFMVYGYMNRGQYEGRVAIILYRFVRTENRIEERLYIPVEEPYQTLKENMGRLNYVNSLGVFYIQVYNNIYSYNLITREITQIASNVSKDQLEVLNELNFVAWQDNSDPQKSKNINIMNLETGETEVISSEEGSSIRLMGMIDSNLIYGFVKEKDISSMIDGNILAPLNRIEIASVDKKILKSYSKQDFYISGLEVKDNIIELRRVQKVTENGRTAYTLASPDYIMNQVKSEAKASQVTSRVTDQALTEYYLMLPKGFVMGSVPKIQNTVNTVIDEDPTIRLPISAEQQMLYYPYISGEIVAAYDNAADAIRVARDQVGVVLNNNQQMVWERGVKATTYTIENLQNMTWSSTQEQTVETCIQLMLACQKVDATVKQLSVKNSSAYDVLKQNSKYTPIRLTGITLDDALYFVSKGRPVLAMTGISDAVLIYGYDAFNIMIIDPKNNKVTKRGIQDSAQMFEDAGNVFISYLEQ